MRGLYEKSLIENGLPIKQISELALKEGNSKKPVYKIHKWWARRLGAVVRALLIGATMPFDATEEEFWGQFYSKNKIDLTVLDPFMGGGTTLVESKKMGAKTIGVDIDPLACFITRKELEPMGQLLDDELEKLHQRVGKRIQEFYITEVEGLKYPIINAFWVYNIVCSKCDNIIKTHPHYKLNFNKKMQFVFCKHCGQIHEIDINKTKFKCSACSKITIVDKGTYKRGYCTCPNCNNKFEIQPRIQNSKKLELFALEYEKEGQRYYKKADKKDIELYMQVKQYSIKHLQEYFVPETHIPIENRKDTRPVSYGYHYYRDLFNSRQLISLAMLLHEIKKISNKEIREWFLITFSDFLASNNMLCNYAYGYRKLTPLFGIHAYTVPMRPVENNVWGADSFGRGSFKKSLSKVIEAKLYCENIYESKYGDKGLIKSFTGEKIRSNVTNQHAEFYSNKADTLIMNRSSEELDGIMNESVDLILTDPPYYDNLNYSELADFYYQWIKPELTSNYVQPLNDSLFVHEASDEEQARYGQRLIKIFRECYIKLRNNGMMVFSYHHNKKRAWSAMGNAIKESGFIITNVFPIRSEGKSGYHTTENSIKWDSIIILRKNDYYKDEAQVNLKELIDFWEEYFVHHQLDLKKCDKLSFYRSLAVQVFTKQPGKDIGDLFKFIEI